MTDVSVVIPTHNRASLVERTLDSLARLDIPAGVSLEVVVVASACTDRTHDVVREAARKLRSVVRMVEESRPGLSLARNRGLEAARADLVAYLDDDVWVEAEWLRALVHAATHLPAAIFAGRVSLEWASNPPRWCSPAVERLLSVNDLGNDVREFTRASALVGANFAIRRSVVDTIGDFSPALGRRGGDLLSGEESELVARALRAGHRLFYVPTMAVRHWIPSQRASLDHVRALAFGRGRTRVILQRAGREKSARACAWSGMARALVGSLRELNGWMERDESKRIAASLIRHRGLGMLYALLQTGGGARFSRIR